MDEYLNANRELWNTWTGLHIESEFYDVAGFKEGRSSLRPVERAELAPRVAGKTMLHLQCHFGLDSLSWAREGAVVTGVDLADEAITAARQLSAETGIPATFVCADVLTLPGVLSGEFDIVFCSYGILHWLPDLARWASAIAHFLKPGGIFYIVEDHPMMRACSGSPDGTLRIENQYFFTTEPWSFEMQGSFAAPGGAEAPRVKGYNWDHALSETLNALIGAGLQLEFLHEFPFHVRAKFPGMVPGEDKLWRLVKQHGMIPLLFSLQAKKP